MKWKLEVSVPPDTQFGAFPEESVIILRTQETPPRFIRIPVTGNGQFWIDRNRKKGDEWFLAKSFRAASLAFIEDLVYGD